MRLRLPDLSIDFPRRPLVMGIVNVNDDSFSGDGTLDIDHAVELARKQIAAGADIIDVGAESARTNRGPIDVGEEVRRFGAFIGRWGEVLDKARPRDEAQVWPPVLSANTWRQEVVAEILPLGHVGLLNDMGALPDDRNARLCAEHGTALLVMHSVGQPKVPHVHQQWVDVMASMEQFFADKLKLCENAGLHADATVLDPGIDFAKQRDDNLTVLRDFSRLDVFNRPILLPVSRKTVIGDVLDLADPRDRDAGTIACIASCMKRGGHIFRVHHVDAAWQAVKTLHALV
jgi:dihydropteroate synthase